MYVLSNWVNVYFCIIKIGKNKIESNVLLSKVVVSKLKNMVKIVKKSKIVEKKILVLIIFV